MPSSDHKLARERGKAKVEYAIVLALVGVIVAIGGGYLSRASRGREIERLQRERDDRIQQLILATRPADKAAEQELADAVRRVELEYDRRISAVKRPQRRPE
jgi:hypothetical protein